MLNLINDFVAVYTAVSSSTFIFYFLVMLLALILYFFSVVATNFFRIIISFLFLFISSVLLSMLNVDFFSGFLLVAELPVLLILLLFYFNKTSIQIDNLYKFSSRPVILFNFFLFFSFLCTLCQPNTTLAFTFYNYSFNDLMFIFSKNDFLVLFYNLYKLAMVFVFIFAILIFFVSLLVILVHQVVKVISLKAQVISSNVLILRKQSLVKQGVFVSKLKFFNKKL